MAKKIKRDSKDSAAKHTLNPPPAADLGKRPVRRAAPSVAEAQPADREVGQFTGRGTPPLQKK
jgi:hypothetical protein